MKAVPLSLAEANAFVTQHHRHHPPVAFHKFSIGAATDKAIVGVCIVGRPVSRHRDDGMPLEVSPLCTDGTRNACSFLYSKAARAAFAMGYARIGTYILASETGASLTAANWRQIGQTRGGSWNTAGRPRVDKHPLQKKLLFEATP